MSCMHAWHAMWAMHAWDGKHACHDMHAMHGVHAWHAKQASHFIPETSYLSCLVISVYAQLRVSTKVPQSLKQDSTKLKTNFHKGIPGRGLFFPQKSGPFHKKCLFVCLYDKTSLCSHPINKRPVNTKNL